MVKTTLKANHKAQTIFRLPYPVSKGSLKPNPTERRRLADILAS
nr:hypothetical protein [uncultured Kingella sp.]